MSAVERFKRALDSVVNELEEERTRPYKKPKLDSAAEQASTNALINKNHLQQHKSNSTEKQVGANALLSKNQELRGEDHSANSVPKQDAMQPSDQIPPQS